jgi:hypothetical protein
MCKSSLFVATLFLAAVFSKPALANPTYHNYQVVVNGSTWYIGTYQGAVPNGYFTDLQSKLGFSAASGAMPWIGKPPGQDAAAFAAALGSGLGVRNPSFDQANTTPTVESLSLGPIFYTFQSGGFQGGQAWDGTQSIQAVGSTSNTSLVWAFATTVAVPEIDGKMLPQVALLLGSLYLLFVFGRRGAGRRELASPALAQAA